MSGQSEGFGNWVGGWAYYTGDSANLGSFHGDPGEFTYGYGAELPYGQKISFGKGSDRYVCRMEQNGLTCVNSAKGSAVLLNDQGVTPYGMLDAVAFVRLPSGAKIREDYVGGCRRWDGDWEICSNEPHGG